MIRLLLATYAYPPSVGGVKQASDYLKLFDYTVDLLVAALKTATGH